MIGDTTPLRNSARRNMPRIECTNPYAVTMGHSQNTKEKGMPFGCDKSSLKLAAESYMYSLDGNALYAYYQFSLLMDRDKTRCHYFQLFLRCQNGDLYFQFPYSF